MHVPHCNYNNMYNEQTNAHMIDSSYYTVLYLSLLHVSKPTHPPQEAPTWCLQSYINMFMQSWWYFFTFVVLNRYYNKTLKLS